MISIRWRSYSGREWHTEIFASDKACIDWLIANQALFATMTIERYA